MMFSRSVIISIAIHIVFLSACFLINIQKLNQNIEVPRLMEVQLMEIPDNSKGSITSSAPTVSQGKKSLKPEQNEPPSEETPEQNPNEKPSEPSGLNPSDATSNTHTGGPSEGSGEVATVSQGELDNGDPAVFGNKKPDYPLIARTSQIEGYVTLNILVNNTGEVLNVQVLDVIGHPSFATEAVKVARRWRFQPLTSRGRKVRAWVQKKIIFKLRD